MAARKPRPDRAWTPEKVRERIRTSLLVHRLTKHVLGKLEMTPTQVAAAQTLLRKSLPDLSAVEHSGKIDSRTEKELTDAELAAIAGNRGTGATEQTFGSKEPGEIH